MKTLFLIRHAEAAPSDPEITDLERELTAKGLEDSVKIGKRIASYDNQPQLIISSPAKRAISTAITISGQFKYDSDKIIIDERLYYLNGRSFNAIMSDVDDEIKSVMIVSHNPGLQYLVDSLSDTPVRSVPSGSVAEFEITTWNNISPSNCRLISLKIPA